MTKELSFDDEDDVYSVTEEDEYEDDLLMDNQIPGARFAEIIEEFGATAERDDFYDDEDSRIDFDSLGLQ